MSNERRHVYCLCGAWMYVHVKGGDATGAVNQFTEVFRGAHQGKGHGPATAAEGLRARRRKRAKHKELL